MSKRSFEDFLHPYESPFVKYMRYPKVMKKMDVLGDFNKYENKLKDIFRKEKQAYDEKKLPNSPSTVKELNIDFNNLVKKEGNIENIIYHITRYLICLNKIKNIKLVNYEDYENEEVYDFIEEFSNVKYRYFLTNELENLGIDKSMGHDRNLNYVSIHDYLKSIIKIITNLYMDKVSYITLGDYFPSDYFLDIGWHIDMLLDYMKYSRNNTIIIENQDVDCVPTEKKVVEDSCHFNLEDIKELDENVEL